MTTDEIANRIKNYIQDEMGIELSDCLLTLSENGLDSLELVNVITWLEAEFSIEFSVDDLEPFTYFNELVQLVEKYL